MATLLMLHVIARIRKSTHSLNSSTGWGTSYSYYNTNSVEFQYFRESRFVKEGYRKFKKYARRQEAAYKNPGYWNTATRLLGQFTNLDSATVYDQWEQANISCVKPLNAMSHGEFCRFWSPLHRSWNPVHSHPLGWSYLAIPRENVTTSNGTREFSVMNSFLKGTPRRLKRLETAGSGLPPESLNVENSTCASLILEGFWAYAFIETLNLTLETTMKDDDEGNNYLPITGLTALLRSASRLKHLSLSLPIHNGINEQYYKLSEVFPLQPPLWPALRTFYIGNISVEAAHWIMPLHFRMPELRSLQVGAVTELSGATWNEVIECMHHHLKLSCLRISYYGLMYPDPSIAWIRDVAQQRAVFERIKSYVEHGGRHPCLNPGQPDDAFRVESEKLFSSAQSLMKHSGSTGS